MNTNILTITLIIHFTFKKNHNTMFSIKNHFRKFNVAEDDGNTRWLLEVQRELKQGRNPSLVQVIYLNLATLATLANGSEK